MSELSQEEKDKIRAEMEYRESVSRAAKAPLGTFDKVLAFSAHPVIVTVLGGILLVCVGQSLQQNYAIEQGKSAREKYFYDKKLAIASSFPAQIHKDVTLLFNRSGKRLFLYKNKDKPEAKDLLGRTRQDIKGLYDRLVDEDIKNARPTALLSEVRTWFCAEKVVNLVDATDKMIEEFEDLGPAQLTDQIIDAFGKKAERQLRELAQAMADEIRDNRHCARV